MGESVTIGVELASGMFYARGVATDGLLSCGIWHAGSMHVPVRTTVSPIRHLPEMNRIALHTDSG